MAKLTHIGLVLAGIALGAVGAPALHAEESVTRVELQRADLTGTSGTEVIVATLEIHLVDAPVGGGVLVLSPDGLPHNVDFHFTGSSGQLLWRGW